MKNLSFLVLAALSVLFLSCGEKQNPKWISFTSSKTIIALASDDEYMWAGTSSGLVRIDAESGESIFYNKSNSGISSNNVKSIVVDKEGDKWIIVDNYLVKFDGYNWIKYSTSNSGLPIHYLDCLEIDKEGNIWIGTYNSIVKFDGVNWTTFKTHNYRDGFDNIWSISIDSKNNKWIVTGRGLFNFNGNEWTKFAYSNPDFPVSHINCIVIDKSDYLWLGTPNGLTRFDGKKCEIYNTTNSRLVDNNILSIAIDKNDNKILRTKSGLTKFNGKDFISLKGSILEGIANNLDLVTIDNENNIWVSKGKRLERFDGTNWKRFKTSESNYPFESIYSLAIDSKNNKWIVGNKLIKFDGKNYKEIKDSDEENYRRLTASMLDKNDHFWVENWTKVKMYDGSKWIAFDSSNSSLSERHIEENYSMYVNGIKQIFYSYTLINTIVEDRKGNIWIGTYGGGLVKFDGINWSRYDKTNSNIPDNFIYSISIDKNNKKWLGISKSRIVEFNDSSFITQTIPFEPSDFSGVGILKNDINGNLWAIITIPGGCTSMDESFLFKFDGKIWTRFDSKNSGLPSECSFPSMIIDDYNNIWIGTSGNGLVKFDGKKWITYNSKNSGLQNNWISSIVIDEYNNKWIGTFDGLAVFNENGIDLEKINYN